MLLHFLSHLLDNVGLNRYFPLFVCMCTVGPSLVPQTELDCRFHLPWRQLGMKLVPSCELKGKYGGSGIAVWDLRLYHLFLGQGWDAAPNDEGHSIV